ncbi:MAG: tRNA epoxyqueuosine(34) reductase QueG [bacterium]|nr:tRNA epoxyqueuosine(34) reductase QueG [bacterium]
MKELTEELKERAKELGFVLAGVAPAAAPGRLQLLYDWLDSNQHGQMSYLETRREAYSHPDSVLNGCRSVLMLALPYSSSRAERETESSSISPARGRVARYAQSPEDYHDVIHRRLKKLKQWLLSKHPHAAIRGIVDTAPFLEREFAELAGLGWVGKNTLLLNREWGSYFFLAALLTDLPLDSDAPTTSGHCGTCTACLDHCPTAAFPKPYVLDARRCISYLTIEERDEIPEGLADHLDGWIFGCDICQEVCPWNRRERPADPELAPLTKTLDLLDVLQIDDNSFRNRFRKSAFWRPRRRGLVRNAILLAATQNLQAAIPSLIRLVGDQEPTLRTAAAWGLAKLQPENWQSILENACACEADPQVKQIIQGYLR